MAIWWKDGEIMWSGGNILACGNGICTCFGAGCCGCGAISEITPLTIDVTFTLVANGTCSDCGDMNTTTFTLEQSSDPSFPCNFGVPLPIGVCNNLSINALIAGVGCTVDSPEDPPPTTTIYSLDVFDDGESKNVLEIKTDPAQSTNCQAEHVLDDWPLRSSDGQCDWTDDIIVTFNPGA